MKLKRKEIRLPLDRIDLPGPYCMSYNFSLSGLIRSIKRYGVMNPPLIVFKTGKGRAHVVCGYKRLLALKEIGESEADLLDITESGLSDKELILLSLYENLSIRELNLIEKAMVIKRLSTHMPHNELIGFMSELNLPPSQKHFELLIEIEMYPDSIKREIAKGSIPLKTIEYAFDKFDKDGRLIVLDLISKLKLSFNYQFQLLDILKDLSFNQKKSIQEILKESGINSTVEDKKMNPAQKGKAVIKIIRERRFPLLSKAQKEYLKRVSSLDLPDGTRIEPPLYFESNQFKLELRFSSQKELKDKLNKIIKIIDIKKIIEPF